MVSFGKCRVSGVFWSVPSELCLLGSFPSTYVISLTSAFCILQRTSLRTHILCNSVILQVDTLVFKPYSRVFGCVSNSDFYSFYARSLLFGEPVKFVPSLRPSFRSTLPPYTYIKTLKLMKESLRNVVLGNFI